MYDQIPALISMLPLEKNLDVLGELYRALNKLLVTDIEMRVAEEEALRRFEVAWEVKKKQLEETKGDKK